MEVRTASPAEPRPVIVVIDDDAAMRLSCQRILAKTGFQVEVFEDGVQGVEGVQRLRPDLLIVDLKMPGISGLEVISRVQPLDPSLVIVVITGYATIDTAVEAMKAGAYDFLPKPFSPDELRLIVNRGLERRRLMLEARRQEVERELLRRRFVAFVSHQLQTPLAAIHQYLNVLKHLEDEPSAAAKRAEWYDRCLKRLEEMLGLIRNWLSWSAVERRCLARQCVPVSLEPIIMAVLEDCRPMAEKEGISLQTCLPSGGCPVLGDPDCLRVLIENLVTNAIKYNKPGGEVCISVESGGPEAQVAVADTGVGIPEQYRRLLFDEFFRVSEAGKAAGAGLGLAIVKRIVSELNGRIEVQSEVGVGSTFRVWLPASAPPAPQDSPPAQEEQSVLG